MDWRTRISRRILHVLPAGLLAMAISSSPGCVKYELKQTERPPTAHLELRHEAHGTAHATVVDEDVWYVLQGNRLLVIDQETGRQVSETDLSTPGLTGPAVDLLVEPTSIHVVLRDSAVVVLDRTDPRRPWLESRWNADELGIAPRAIDPGREGPIVSGVGGSVQLPSLHHLVDHDDEMTSVVELDGVSLYTTGRRAYRVSDDTYVGSATRLEQLPAAQPGGPASPAGVVLPEGVLFFVRNEITGGLGGFAVLEGGILREVDSRRSTEALPGAVNRLRIRGDRLLIVGARSVHLYRVDVNGTLHETWSQDLEGIRDADFLDDRDIVVVGDFGQARLRTDRHGDAMVIHNDAPGGLLQAISDGRLIMATGVNGTWEYRIGDTADLVSGQPRLYPEAPKSAAMLGWEVTITGDGREAQVSNDLGMASLPAPPGSRYTTVSSGDGTFWIGHTDGVIMLKPPKSLPPMPLGWDEMTQEEKQASGLSPMDGVQKLTVDIDGPVIFLQPLDLGGGVAYAASHGGFGVVREIW